MVPPAAYGTKHPPAGRTRAGGFIERGREKWINMVDERSTGKTPHSAHDGTQPGTGRISSRTHWLSCSACIVRRDYRNVPSQSSGIQAPTVHSRSALSNPYASYSSTLTEFRWKAGKVLPMASSMTRTVIFLLLSLSLHPVSGSFQQFIAESFA